MLHHTLCTKRAWIRIPVTLYGGKLFTRGMLVFVALPQVQLLQFFVTENFL